MYTAELYEDLDHPSISVLTGLGPGQDFRWGNFQFVYFNELRFKRDSELILAATEVICLDSASLCAPVYLTGQGVVPDRKGQLVQNSS